METKTMTTKVKPGRFKIVVDCEIVKLHKKFITWV